MTLRQEDFKSSSFSFCRWSIGENNWKLHFVNPKRKEHRQGSRFKVSSEGLSTEINKNRHTNTVTHQSTNRGRRCLTRLYQAVDYSSVPINTSQSQDETILLIEIMGCCICICFVAVIANKIAIACVTFWLQHNCCFPFAAELTN